MSSIREEIVYMNSTRLLLVALQMSSLHMLRTHIRFVCVAADKQCTRLLGFVHCITRLRKPGVGVELSGGFGYRLLYKVPLRICLTCKVDGYLDLVDLIIVFIEMIAFSSNFEPRAGK